MPFIYGQIIPTNEDSKMSKIVLFRNVLVLNIDQIDKQ